MFILLRGDIVEQIRQRQPSVIAGYSVMSWEGEKPIAGQIWNPETEAFEDAPEPAAPPTHRTDVSPGEFKRLFTMTERLAIDRARDQALIDAITDDEERAAARELKRALDIFFGDLEDPLLPTIDVLHPDVAVGLESVRAAGLIEDHRTAEIQFGWPLLKF